MAKRAAIVLAGGKAERFQNSKEGWQDKALALLDGKPLLLHAVEHVQSLVDEVVIVVNDNQSRILQYQALLERCGVENVRIVTDLKVNGLRGPLIAILTGLKAASADFCLTIPADMPLLNAKVADYMFNELDGATVAVPMWPNGRLETLLMVLNRKAALKIAETLCELGRSHPDDIMRGTEKALFVSPLGTIKSLDPKLKSFVNINFQEDLNRLQPRQVEDLTPENVRLDLGNMPEELFERISVAASKRAKADFEAAAEIFSGCAMQLEKERLFFWAAVSHEYQAKCCLSAEIKKLKLVCEAKAAFFEAAKNYQQESEIYDRNGCYLLAQRAKADSIWCLARGAELK